MDFGQLFGIHVSPLELFVRGTLMYWFIFLLFRFVLRRDAGGIGIADILLVVLIADAAQNGMAADYQSVTEGLILVGTLIGWNFALDWAGYRWEAVRKFMEPPPLLLVHRGRFVVRNMRREFVTREEIEGELRKKGIASVAGVHRAYLESDGSFSVVCTQPAQPPLGRRRARS
jgi:uncharacterized membrane protein YcaP (DUF421 family)